MTDYKKDILTKICYTELVYGRINKKLASQFSKAEVEKKLFDTIKKTNDGDFRKTGKNVYVSNQEENIRITINLNTYRVITVDPIIKHRKQ